MDIKNQPLLADQYRKQKSIRKEIKKIIHRKYNIGWASSYKTNIIKDLQATLFANELVIEKKGDDLYEVVWKEQRYNL
jgi:uncharacterized protein (UPF0332 family)